MSEQKAIRPEQAEPHLYPLEPLFRATGALSAYELADRLGINSRSLYRYQKAGGINAAYADEFAIRIGKLPHEVWDDYDKYDVDEEGLQGNAGRYKSGASKPAFGRTSKEVKAIAHALAALIHTGLLSGGLDRIAKVVEIEASEIQTALDALKKPELLKPKSKFAPVIASNRAALEAVRVVKNVPFGSRGCARCLEVKDLEEFPFKSSAAGYRRSYCRPCWADLQRERWVNAKELKLINAVRLVLTADSQYLSEHCERCGEGLCVGDEVQAVDALLSHTRCLG